MKNGILLFESRLWLKMHILSSGSSLKNSMSYNPIEKITEHPKFALMKTGLKKKIEEETEQRVKK